jgi:hypothetical protein
VSSLNRDESTNPATIKTEIRYHTSGVYILNVRMTTKLIREPTPAECNEIFHQKFITVIITDNTKTAIIKDFRKSGIGKRKRIKEVSKYSKVEIMRGIFLSSLLLIAQELMRFL